MLPFVKMHGIGNDYVYLDAVGDPAIANRRDLPALARAVSHRHTGVGSDGLILVCLPTPAGRAEGAHVRMRMFNADGSESGMCGNGVRCVAKFAHDRLGVTHTPICVETGNGVLKITYTLDDAGRLDTATVDMGEPTLELEAAGLRGLEAKANTPGKPVAVPLPGGGRPEGIMVGTGNPHAVFFIEKDGTGPNAALGGVSGQMEGGTSQYLSSIDLGIVGPQLSLHPMFKKFTNVHIAAVQGTKTVDMRTWERGSGITQACGTGACAVVVAGVTAGRLGRDVKVTLPGGSLQVRWDEHTNHVFMTGPAVEICTGLWPDEKTKNAPAPLVPIPTLTTDRLTLRPLTQDDAPAVAALAADKRISDTTLTVPYPYKPEHASSWISTHAIGHASRLNTVWGAFDNKSGQLIGTVGVVYSPPHNTAEIGYWIGVPFWNRGYASEAGAAVLRYAFEQRDPPLQRVDAHHFIGNEASGRVMTKMGMLYEGLCLAAARKLDRAVDVARYAVTREQWLERDAKSNVKSRDGAAPAGAHPAVSQSTKPTGA